MESSQFRTLQKIGGDKKREFKGTTESVVYTHITLTEEGFNNLVLFNAPPRFEHDGKRFLKSLCTVRLYEAVEKVLEKISDYDEHGASVWDTLDMVLKNTSDSCDEWFAHLLSLGKSFDLDCMGKLWIRNLSNPDCTSSGGLNDGKENPEGSFYITDGSHRALIYAVKVRCDVFAYKDHPVKAIHATTWSNLSGVFGWQAAMSCQLQNKGVFDKNQNRQFYLVEFEEPGTIRVVPQCD